MKRDRVKTVGDVVNDNLFQNSVFGKHGIDYLNKGVRKLTEPRKHSMNDDNIEQQVLKARKNGPYPYNQWGLDYLIDHILNNHHYFIWVNLPVIKEYALKVARMQGASYPVVIEVNRLFKDLASDLERHLTEQEHQLFPYIKQLVYAKRDRRKISRLDSNTLLYQLEADHLYFAEKLQLIINLLRKLTIANEQETTPSVLLFKLRAFQIDLYHHIYLETNILLPKARELEKKVLEN